MEYGNAMAARAEGCFMGQVIGDSLGSRVEFFTVREIGEAFPGGVRDMAGGGAWGLLAGQPTDDSEMAIALARSIVVNGNAYSAAGARECYLDWIASPNAFGIGGTIGPALLYGRFNSGSQANGAMMRVAPLGIWGACRSRSMLQKCAVEDACLTHANPIVSQCNEIFASLIAEAVSTGKNAEELYGSLLEEPELFTSKGRYERCILEWITAARDTRWKIDGDNRGWVAIALWNALYRLLHARDFTEAVVQTVNEGGDTDTNAAIAGALFGAVYGIGAIPKGWREIVMNCRPAAGSGTRFPRPERFWPSQVPGLARSLISR